MLATEPITSNRLLGALPLEEFSHLKPHLEPVNLQFRQVIYNVDDPVNFIYFPEKAVISNVKVLEDGECLETGIIGSEGMTGFSTVFKQNYSPYETTVQVAGSGWRIKTKDFWNALDCNGAVPRPILAFADAYTEQSTQSAACAQHHSLTKRMVKRFLMYQDWIEQDATLPMNQESIALMLGVSRGSVVNSANELRDAGLIKYSRGKVKITDRKALEDSACECYGTIKRAYSHYLSQLESKELIQRADKNSEEFAAMVRWRNNISKEADQSIREFRRVQAMSQNIPLLVKTCSKCQRLCNLQYQPLTIPKDNKRLLQVLSSSGFCTVCLNANDNIL